MANLLLAHSITKIKTHNERRNYHKKTDDDILGQLEDVIIRLPQYHKSAHKRIFHKLQDIPECKTEKCSEQSWNMSQMMDASADPCQDFYQYACGGWIAEGLPEDHAKWTIFAYLAEQTENKLRDLIESQKDAANGSVAKLVYNWYASCMDQKERDRLKATPLLNLLNGTLGMDFHPFVSKENFSDVDWVLEDVLATVHRYLGVYPLFKVSLGVDPRNSSSPTHLTISQSKPLIQAHNLQIHNAYLTVEEHAIKIVKAYLRLMGNVALLLGGLDNQDPFALTDEIKHVLLLEVSIVRILHDVSAKESESEIAIWTVQDFQREVPGFDWGRYFSKLTEGLGDQSFSSSEEVFVESPMFFKRLIELLNSVRHASGSTIANYITWFIVYNYAPYLSSDFHEAYLQYAKEAYGIQKSSPPWRRCVRGTDESLDMGVSMLFINGSGFTNESIVHANDMVQQIREAFIDNLKTVNWMDSATKEAAKEKAEAILQQIGYPKFIVNETLLMEYFDGLTVDPKRLFQNRLTEKSIRMKNTLLFRGKPQSRLEWQMRPTEINAYYSPTGNKIVVPAGILRPPFYHVEYPHAENFGAIGFVVGHELTHGFDVTGAMFDKEGNLANWWSKSSLSNFREREGCFVRQYSADSVLGHNLNGKKTLGENTADNGGLKLAYKAYKKWRARKDHETRLPNLSITSDQLFFLSFAQIWCEKSTPGYALTDLAVNVHSPGKFRVVETLRNNVDFAKAFNCKLGSPMNPEQKCEVW